MISFRSFPRGNTENVVFFVDDPSAKSGKTLIVDATFFFGLPFGKAVHEKLKREGADPCADGSKCGCIRGVFVDSVMTAVYHGRENQLVQRKNQILRHFFSTVAGNLDATVPALIPSTPRGAPSPNPNHQGSAEKAVHVAEDKSPSTESYESKAKKPKNGTTQAERGIRGLPVDDIGPPKPPVHTQLPDPQEIIRMALNTDSDTSAGSDQSGLSFVLGRRSAGTSNTTVELDDASCCGTAHHLVPLKDHGVAGIQNPETREDMPIYLQEEHKAELQKSIKERRDMVAAFGRLIYIVLGTNVFQGTNRPLRLFWELGDVIAFKGDEALYFNIEFWKQQKDKWTRRSILTWPRIGISRFVMSWHMCSHPIIIKYMKTLRNCLFIVFYTSLRRQ